MKLCSYEGNPAFRINAPTAKAIVLIKRLCCFEVR